MLLFIDNYDSFTYNIVQYFAELGQEINVRRNDDITLDEIAELQPHTSGSALAPARPKKPAFPCPPCAVLPGRFPFWVCASATRPSAKPSAAASCARKS